MTEIEANLTMTVGERGGGDREADEASARSEEVALEQGSAGEDEGGGGGEDLIESTRRMFESLLG